MSRNTPFRIQEIDNFQTESESVYGVTEPQIVYERSLSEKPSILQPDDLGALAFEDAVEKAKLGTTVIDGGYLVTGMVNASRIDAGSLTIDPDNDKVEAIVVKKGGDIFIEGDNTNPGKLVFRDGDDISKYWELYMDVDTTSDFLYLLPNGMTYRDFWIGRFGTTGTDAEKTATALRNLFVKTGNTLSGGSRPGIIFENWNAYGDYFSLLKIGDSDTESLVEIGGNLKPTSDDTYNLGSSTKGWKNLYLNDGRNIYESGGLIRFSHGIGMPNGSKITIGLTAYEPRTIYYKDHSGNNVSMTVLAFNP